MQLLYDKTLKQSTTTFIKNTDKMDKQLILSTLPVFFQMDGTSLRGILQGSKSKQE